MTRPRQPTPSAGTSPDRAANLRQDCLRRDGNKCIATGTFNLDELSVRGAGKFQDDDGNSLQGNKFSALEVAHIIPHALGWGDDSNESSRQYRLNVLTILDMFRPGTMGLYHGQEIDCPQNALTLEPSQHILFGRLETYFEPVQGSEANYIVHHVNEAMRGISTLYPSNITFRTVTDIPLPDADLLAIHSACARIV